MADSDDSVEDLIAGIDFIAIAESVKKSKKKNEGILDVVWSDEESFNEDVNSDPNVQTPDSLNKQLSSKDNCSFSSVLNSDHVTLRKRNEKTSSSASSVSDSCCIQRALSFDECALGEETFSVNTEETYCFEDSGLFIDCEQTANLEIDVLEDIITQYDIVDDNKLHINQNVGTLITSDVSAEGTLDNEYGYSSGDSVFISQKYSKSVDDTSNLADTQDSQLFLVHEENEAKNISVSILERSNGKHQGHWNDNFGQSSPSSNGNILVIPEKKSLDYNRKDLSNLDDQRVEPEKYSDDTIDFVAAATQSHTEKQSPLENDISPNNISIIEKQNESFVFNNSIRVQLTFADGINEEVCGVSGPQITMQNGIIPSISQQSHEIVSIPDDCMKANRGLNIQGDKSPQQGHAIVNMYEQQKNTRLSKESSTVTCNSSNELQNVVSTSIEYDNKPQDIDDNPYYNDQNGKEGNVITRELDLIRIKNNCKQEDEDSHEPSYEKSRETPELSRLCSRAKDDDFQTDQVEVFKTPTCKEESGQRYEQGVAGYFTSLGTHNTEDIFSSSDDEYFEAFLTEMKTPRNKNDSEHFPSMESFIVDDWVDVSSGEDEPPPLLNRILGDLKSTPEGKSISIFTQSRKASYITIGSSSDEENNPHLINENIMKPKKGILSTKKTNDSKPALKTPRRNVQIDERSNFDSSSTRGIEKIMTPYLNTPKRLWHGSRDDLSKQLFCCYNETVFQNKLPHDMPITWNKHMRKTAGFCYYIGSSNHRKCRIELSDKVVDSCDRIRDTLIHELCHAATWLIDGIKAGHGPHWKKWANIARRAHRDLPPISRCHTYEINYKFNYRCTKCDYSIGRHSKSIDLKKAKCPYCLSCLKLLPKLNNDGTPAKTRREPTKFTLFVKEHYGEVKNELSGTSHQEIMKELSKRFYETKENV